MWGHDEEPALACPLLLVWSIFAPPALTCHWEPWRRCLAPPIGYASPETTEEPNVASSGCHVLPGRETTGQAGPGGVGQRPYSLTFGSRRGQTVVCLRFLILVPLTHACDEKVALACR